jgi:hypothetical protein
MSGYTYGAATALTVTNLHSLASSATAGWQSDAIDLSAGGSVDVLVQAVLDFANTAPANEKAAFLYAYSALETTYTNPATGSEGTITLTNVTTTPNALRLVGVIPYQTQDEIVESSVFSVAAAFGGALPAKVGFVLINFSGAALHSSGSTLKYRLVSIA